MCLSQKSLFLYSKDLVVSHIYSYIPYSKEMVVSMFLDTFRNQKCLETVKQQNPLKYSENLVNSPVSRPSLLEKVRRLEGLKVGML